MTGRFETPPIRFGLNQNVLFSAVKRRGAVSPAIRAVASRMPVAIPARAARQVMLVMTLDIGAPKAAPASRNEPGTMLRRSSVVRTITGVAMIASATPPAHPEYPPIG